MRDYFWYFRVFIPIVSTDSTDAGVPTQGCIKLYRSIQINTNIIQTVHDLMLFERCLNQLAASSRQLRTRYWTRHSISMSSKLRFKGNLNRFQHWRFDKKFRSLASFRNALASLIQLNIFHISCWTKQRLLRYSSSWDVSMSHRKNRSWLTVCREILFEKTTQDRLRSVAHLKGEGTSPPALLKAAWCATHGVASKIQEHSTFCKSIRGSPMECVNPLE